MIYDGKAWWSTDDKLRHIYQGTLFTRAFPKLARSKLTLLVEINLYQALFNCRSLFVFAVQTPHCQAVQIQGRSLVYLGTKIGWSGIGVYSTRQGQAVTWLMFHMHWSMLHCLQAKQWSAFTVFGNMHSCQWYTPRSYTYRSIIFPPRTLWTVHFFPLWHKKGVHLIVLHIC